MSESWRETEHIVRRMREDLDRADPSPGGQDAEPLVALKTGEPNERFPGAGLVVAATRRRRGDDQDGCGTPVEESVRLKIDLNTEVPRARSCHLHRRAPDR
jgi:hypothetical protein